MKNKTKDIQLIKVNTHKTYETGRHKHATNKI